MLALGVLACGPSAPEGAVPPSAPLPPAPPPPAAEAAPPPAEAPAHVGEPAAPAEAAPALPGSGIGPLVFGGGTLAEARRGPCAAHADCAVVSGACGGLYAVLAEDAPAERRRTAEFARTASCAGGAPEAAVPRCEAGACVAHPLDHPAWRLGCRDAGGCVVVPRGCTGFDAVTTRHARAAARAWREEGCASRPSPVPGGEAPAHVCESGTCALASE